MPLYAQQYSEELHAEQARNFSCCSNPQNEFEADLDDLIFNKDRLDRSLERGNEIWLYYESEDLEPPFVAYAMFGPNNWKIHGNRTPISFIPAMAVDSRFKRRGHGKDILKQLVQKAHEEHSDAIYVGLLVHKDNTPAQRLYQEMGFSFLSNTPKNDHFRMLLPIRRT